MSSIKYQFGSIYEPNQNTVDLNSINFKIEPKKQTWLEFKNKHNFPYVYIIDVITNEISEPILATPIYECNECLDSIVYMNYEKGCAICNKCNKTIDVIPHLFFNTNIYYYRKNASIKADKLNENGIPINWELKNVKNVIAHTYNDIQRVYDSGIIMKECNIDLINKYKKIAKISNNHIRNKQTFKILIYRNLATPIYYHHGVGLELEFNKWKIISIKDQEQFMAKVMPLIDVPNIYINIENVNNDVKEVLSKKYLN